MLSIRTLPNDLSIYLKKLKRWDINLRKIESNRLSPINTEFQCCFNAKIIN